MMDIIRHFGKYSIIRDCYVRITGDICAAQILAAIEDWTIAQIVNNRGDIENAWIGLHVDSLIGCVCGTFGRDKVLDSFELLTKQGFIEQRPSEDPNGWVFCCLLNIEKVQQALDNLRRETGGK